MVVDHAVIVRNATKQYGKGACILNGLNLTVPRGCIYGLLGASGCGKTTLLSCVVGVRKLDSGDIWVLGGKPGCEESGIPGPCVGYMPQDVSLVEEFSVIGALFYFGRINGLDDRTIEDRYTYLQDLLQLPPRNRLIKNMSGGQQRRVSFAAALLHGPELLILDEPTVGLDPVLRENIWNHLVKITREEGVTVIITTHYIEEARQADKIGLLRHGQLLAESSPRDLLDRFQTDSLEEAFLNLSQFQSQQRITGQPANTIAEANNFIEVDPVSIKCRTQRHRQFQTSSKRRCQALLVKNGLQFVRYPGGVLFSIILPIMQVMIFFNSVGGDPKDMSISIVNGEAGNCNYGRNRGNVTYDTQEERCNFQDLSCRIIDGLNSSILSKVYYDSYEEAMDRIAKDKSIGIMYFNRNFSSSMAARIEGFFTASEDDIVGTQVEITLQTPDRQIAVFMKQNLFKDFYKTLKDAMKECGLPPKFVEIPVQFEEPVFGSLDQNYQTFIAPPFVLSTLFVMATSICSSIIITDRNSGVWDRSLVQGVTTTEILATHLLSQIAVIIVQVTLALCICFFHFELNCKGSIVAVICMAVLEGICGMSYGFLISVMCTSHTLVNYASVGSFFPLVLLCGLMWPIEGMPMFLKWLSLALPLTIPGISLRGIMEKGSSMDEPEVYTGFIVVCAWIVALISLCLIHIRIKST